MTSFLNVLKSEYTKTKHTSAFWVSLSLASFIPVIFFIVSIFKPEISSEFVKNPWAAFLYDNMARQSSFFMPMMVVLATSMLVQLEVKNNAWKQVFATPATPTQLFFAKFLVIQIMIVLYFVFFILSHLICGSLMAIVNSDFKFLTQWPNFWQIGKISLKFMFYLLPISALQFWLSLRFKNFIVSFGVGMVLIISGLFALAWSHIYCYPYIQAFLMSQHKTMVKLDPDFVKKTIYFTIGWFVLITGFNYVDFLNRKER
jgi:lantibiotic transport system permease protein